MRTGASLPSSARWKRRLVLSTALGTGWLLGATAAYSQSLPGASDLVSAVKNTAGDAATLTSSFGSDAVSIGLHDSATVISWKHFDIPTGKSISFTDASGVATPHNLAVLNRVVGSDDASPGTIVIPQSQIYGQLNADSNVSVYLINPSGILFGAGSVVNVGGLIASTQALSDSSFFNGPLHFEAQSGTGAGIVVEAGATLGTTGSGTLGRNDLILIGASVSVQAPTGGADAASLTSTGGDVGVIAAEDVTITSAAGSPLAMTIAKGTALPGAFKVNGTISGRNVTLALATRGAVADAILSVDGMVTATSAAVTDRGVLLTADAAGDGVSLSPGAAGYIDAAGSATIVATLTSAREIAVATAGDVSMLGTLASGASADIVITAGGKATLAGAVTSAGDYVVQAASIVIGAAGTSPIQSAVGKVDLTATTGGITAAGTPTLQSNSGNAALSVVNRALFLDAINGTIDLTGSSLLAGADTTGYSVQIRNNATDGTKVAAVTLGNVTASGIAVAGSLHLVSLDTSTSFTGNLTTGDLALSQANFTVAGNASIGAFHTVSGDAVLKATGAGHTITLGAVTVDSGAATLNAAGTLTFSALTASGAATLNGTSISSSGAISADGLSATASGDATLSGTISTTGDDVSITSTTGAISVGGIDAAKDVTLTASGTSADVTTAGISTANGDLSISAGRKATVNGTLSIDGDYSVSATTVALGGDQSATGAITIAATNSITSTTMGSLTVNSDGSHNEALTLRLTNTDPSVTPVLDLRTNAFSILAAKTTSTAFQIELPRSTLSIQLADVRAGLLQGRIGSTGGWSNGLTFTGTGGIQAGDITLTGNSLLLTAQGGTVSTGALTASAVALDARQIATGDISATGGSVTTTGRGAGVSLGNVTANGAGSDIIANASGVGTETFTATSLMAGRDVLIGQTSPFFNTLTVTNASAAGRDFKIKSNAGVIFQAGITAGRDAAIAGVGGVQLTSLSATGTASASDTLQNVSAGSVSGRSVAIQASQSAQIGAITATGGNAAVTATSGTATVSGNVSVTGGAYQVTGGSVTLGNAGNTVSQRATGAVTVTATGGTLSGQSGLTLQSDSNGAGGSALTLLTNGTTGGDIAFGSTTLLGGTISQSDVQIGSRLATNIVTLGDVTAANLLGAAAGGSYTAGITRNAAITVGDVALRNALSLTAAGATLSAGTLSGTTVTLSSGSTLSANAVTASAGAVTIAGAGTLSINGTVAANGSTGDVIVNRSGTLGFGTISAQRDIAIGQSTAATTVSVTGTINAGRAIAITSSGVQGYGDALTGATVTLSSGSILSATDLTASAGAVTINGAGTLSIGGTIAAIGSTGDIIVNRSGALGFGSLSAQRDIAIGQTTVAGNVSVTGATAAGRNVAITSSGAQVYGDTLTGATNVSLTGGTLSLAGAVTATSGALALTATAGDLTAPMLSAGTNASLTATNGILSVTGSLTIPGDYSVTGSSVILGTAGVATVQQASGAITITATGGTLTGLNGLTLHADTDGGGNQALTLATSGTTGGDILFGGTTLLTGAGTYRGAVQIRSRLASNVVTLGDVTAGAMFGAVGNAVFTTGITRTTPIVIGDVTLGANPILGLDSSLRLNASTGALTGGIFSTSGAIVLTADGAMQIDALSGNGIQISGAGALTLNGAINSTAGISITRGGGISLTSLTSGAAATITAGGTASVTGAVTVGGAYQISGTSVLLGSGTTPVVQQAASILAVSTSGTISGGAGLTLRSDTGGTGAGTLILDGAGGIALDTASRLEGGASGSGDIGLRAGAGQSITLGSVVARRLTGAAATTHVLATSLTTTGALTFGGAVTVAQTLNASSTGALTTQAVTVTGAGQSLTLAAGGTTSDLTITGALTAAQDITLSAGHDISFTTATAGNGGVGATAGSMLSGTSMSGGTTASATAGGALTLATLTGQTGVTARGASLSLASATNLTGLLALTATAGDIFAPQVHSGDAVTLVASGRIRVDQASAGSGADLTITSGADLGSTTGTRVTLAAGRDIALTANGALLIGNATAGRNATLSGSTIDALQLTATSGSTNLSATSGSTLIGTLTAGTDATIGADAGVAQIASLITGGGATIHAGSIQLPFARIGGAGLLTSLNDSIVASDLIAGSANISARTTATLGSVSASGALSVETPTTLTANSISTGGMLAIDAAQATLGSIAAGTISATTRAGDLTVSSATSQGAATLTAATTLRATSIDSGGSAALSSGAGGILLGTAIARNGALSLTTLDGGLYGIGSTAPTLTAQGTAGDIIVTTGHDAVIGTATAARDLTIRAGDATVAGRDGMIAIDTINVGRTLTLLAYNRGITTGDTSTGDATISASGAPSDVTVGPLQATGMTTLASSGDLTLSDPIAMGGSLMISAAGTFDAADIRVGGGLSVTATAVQLDLVRAAGDISATGHTIDAGTLASSAGAITLNATSGPIALTSATAGTTLTLTSATSATIGAAQAGGAFVATTQGGPLTIASVIAGTTATFNVNGALQIAAISATQGVALTTSGSATIGSLASGTGTASSPLVLAADPVPGEQSPAATSVIPAGGQVAATVQGDLRFGSIAATSATLNATGAVAITGPVRTSGDYAINAGTITLGNATGTAVAQNAGGKITLTATSGAITGNAGLTLTGTGGVGMTATGNGGAITFATASTISGGSSGAVAIETAGTGSFGAITSSTGTIGLTAADLALNGAVAGGSITLTNRSPTTLTRVGDAPADAAPEFATSDAHFDLSAAEIGRLSAANLVIDAKSGNVRVGDLALAAGTGSTLFQIRTTGRMDMLGRFTATGSPVSRMIVLGGSADETSRASVLRVAATAAGGGRLIAGDATLDLRADTIGVGLDGGFLDAIGVKSGTPATAADIASRYVSQPDSSLYNATLGNASGLYSDPTTVQAGRLIVRYANFALFQNTGTPGTSTALSIGTMGQSQSVQLLASGNSNAFALFGSINGIGDTATSLLSGATLVVGNNVTRANSRANGCLIGAAGGGCLSASIVQPTLAVFDSGRAGVFRSGDDLTLPFDPLVGTSNEALFSDIASVAALGEDVPASEAAAPNSNSGGDR